MLLEEQWCEAVVAKQQIPAKSQRNCWTYSNRFDSSRKVLSACELSLLENTILATASLLLEYQRVVKVLQTII